MLIVALVLAVVGLAALVMAVVTSNELIAWVCIAASAVGVILLIVDALRDRSNRKSDETAPAAMDSDEPETEYVEDYPDEAPLAQDYDEAPTDDTLAVDVEREPVDHEPVEPAAVDSDDESPRQ
ncbi:phage holin family protein [Mycobacterium sp. 4D054]|uniref:phage holin family protein n=1 Tax=unclassified Mycobacterium TaxID=2642494 RepID=UPI0021B1EAE0|nr:phage holin family protein [Mycobacterium sp. SMC-8]UXA11361.1 phage holin family protein [Mycobacterium sp. SMC-8]